MFWKESLVTFESPWIMFQGPEKSPEVSYFIETAPQVTV